MNGQKAENSKGVSFNPSTRQPNPSVAESSFAGNNVPKPYKRAFHPFLCRVKETAAFSISSPKALVDAGFASMGMGLFTFFRPTPLLLFILTDHLHKDDLLKKINKKFATYVICSWEALMMFVLIILGFFLTFSALLKKRPFLLLHPWGLLLLYLDVFVWLTLALYLHLMIESVEPLNKSSFTQVEFPIVYFTVIYIDIALFFVLHYIYATFFITAELTIIEKRY